MANKRAEIEIEHRYFECGDGCCTDWNDEVRVNGVTVAYQMDDILVNILAELLGITEEELFEMDNESDSPYTAELAILKRLGFDATITVDDRVSEDMEHAREMREIFDDNEVDLDFE